MDLNMSICETENRSLLIDLADSETKVEETVLNKAENITKSRTDGQVNLLEATDLVLSKIVVGKNNNKHEFQRLSDVPTHQYKRTAEMLTESEITPAINDKVEVEEAFTIARLYINEMQSDVKNLMQRCQGLETFQANCNRKICEYKRKLTNYQLLIFQYEARILTLTKSMEKAEARERALEEDVDSLRKECAKLKAAEPAQAVNNKDETEKKEAATKIRITFEEQMDQLRNFHQNQIVTLVKKMSKKTK